MRTIIARLVPGVAAPLGAVVDSTGWRNEVRLIRLRYLRPSDPGEAPARGSQMIEVDVGA